MACRGVDEHRVATALMEARHLRAAISARIVKTDRKDARGIAGSMRMSWFRPVHVKTRVRQPLGAAGHLLDPRSLAGRPREEHEGQPGSRPGSAVFAPLACCLAAVARHYVGNVTPSVNFNSSERDK